MQILDKLVRLFYFSLQTESKEGIRQLLQEFFETRVRKLVIRKESLNHAKYRIAFVGLTNVGKSTLIEALLKKKIAPRKNGPATAVSTEFKFAESWQLVLYKRSREVERLSYSDEKSLMGVLEKYVLQSEDVITDVTHVELQGPIELLAGGQLVIVDTPGFGSAQANEEISSTHNANLRRALDDVDEFYFCVSGRECFISDKEKQFFDTNIKSKCSTVIVSKWDDGEDDKNDWQGRFRHLFPGCRFIFTEAKRAIKDGGGHGIAELVQIIQENSDGAGRKMKIEREVLQVVDDFFDVFDKEFSGQKVFWAYPEMVNFRDCLPDSNRNKSRFLSPLAES